MLGRKSSIRRSRTTLRGVGQKSAFIPARSNADIARGRCQALLTRTRVAMPSACSIRAEHPAAADRNREMQAAVGLRPVKHALERQRAEAVWHRPAVAEMDIAAEDDDRLRGAQLRAIREAGLDPLEQPG